MVAVPRGMNPASPSVRIVGRYALYGVIASGGMATVHFGRLIGPVGFSRTVAIKRLHPQFAADPEFVAMFLDEARLAARIRHPHVVPTLDVVATSGELFLVMEYVPGESMSRLIRAALARDALVPASMTVAILAGVLQGLHAAHEAKNEHGAPLGIVHRDVSPQNVLVGADGQARVLDFGVAKAVGRSQTTRDGQIKGKLAYMAPEQLRGETCTRQTDIYAASVVLWEALTGARLFRADNEGAVIKKVLDGEIAPPSRAAVASLGGPALKAVERLDALVLRGLARDPEKRFATAREMALALESALAPATASQVSAWVEDIASTVLLERAAQIADMESSSAALPRSSGTPSPPSPLPAVPATASDPPDGQSGAGLSSVSVASNSPRAPSLPPGRRRTSTLAVGLALLLFAPLVAFAILRTRERGADDATRRSSASSAPSSSSVTSAAAPQPAEPTAPASASGLGAQDAAPVPSPSATAGAPRTPPGRGTNKTAPSRASTCNPPFTYDGAGMKHYKPECL